MKLIGITGHAQHGKDSLAKVLVRDYGYYRIAFADPLKRLAYATNPFIPGIATLRTIVDEQGWEEAKRYPEVRRFLQELGTAARVILGEDVWIRAAEKRMVESSPQPVVFTDVRFPNEAEFIRRHSGELWRVIRPGFDNGVDPNHPSEKFVDTLEGVRRIFINADTIKDLEALVHEAMVSTWA